MLIVEANARQVRRVREAAGITQLELAQLAGISERTVRNAEKGNRLQREFLGYIAEALGVPVHDLEVTSPAATAGERNAMRIMEVVQLFFSTGEYSEFQSLQGSPIEWSQAGPEDIPIFGTFRGRGRIENFLKDVCLPLLEFRTAVPRVQSIQAGKDFVCISWKDSGLGAPTGKVAGEYACMHLYDLEDERIVRIRTVGETHQIVEAFR